MRKKSPERNGPLATIVTSISRQMIIRSLMFAAALTLVLTWESSTPLFAFSAPARATAAVAPTASPRALMERLRIIVVNNDNDALVGLMEWPKGISRDKREPTASHFISVFNRYADFNLALVSDTPTGNSTDHADPNLETVGTFVSSRERRPILLRNLANDGTGDWRVAAETVEAAADIRVQSFQGMEVLIKAYPQASWLERSIAGLQIWQWMGIVLVFVISLAAGKAIALSAEGLSRRAAGRLGSWNLPDARRGLLIPLSIIIAATVFRLGMPYLGLSITLREDLLTAVRLVQIVFLLVLLFRATTIFFAVYDIILKKRDQASASALLPPLRKAVKTLIGILGLLAALATMGFDVSALLAGLGVGGLAVALAGQKTIENLFGGVTIVLDKPVRVGEAGKFGSITGTVEDIGLRSTRIRTLDRTIVTIPNGEFSQMHIETYAARDQMRFYALLGVRYETTPAQILRLRDTLAAMLEAHPLVLPEPRRVRFLNLGSSALELEIFAYVATSNYERYLEVREELNIRILEIVAEVGTECAFPSAASYQASLAPLPEDKLAEAESYRRTRAAPKQPLP